MKKLWIALLLAAFTKLLPGQTFFRAHIDQGPSYWDEVCLSPDGGFGILSFFNIDNDYAYITKFDADGRVEWSRRLDVASPDHEFEGTADITCTADGHFTIITAMEEVGGGSYGTAIIRLDAEGSLVWSKRLPQLNAYSGKSLVADGNDIIVASTNSAEVYLARIRPDGSFQYSQSIKLYLTVNFNNASLSPVEDGRGSLHVNFPGTLNFGAPINSLWVDFNANTGTVGSVQYMAEEAYPAFGPDGAYYFIIEQEDNSTNFARYNRFREAAWCRKINNARIRDIAPSPDGQLKIWTDLYDQSTVLSLNAADASFRWNKMYLSMHFPVFFNRRNKPLMKHLPDGRMLWVSNWFENNIARLDREGNVEGCQFFEPCLRDIREAEAPAWEAITWNAMIYSQGLSLEVIVADNIVDGTDVCNDQLPTADFSIPERACAGETLRLNGRGFPVPDFTSEWFIEGGEPGQASGNSVTVSFPEAGNYTLRHVITAAGCRDTAEHSILVSALPSFSLSTDADSMACAGDTLWIHSGLSPDTNQLEWQDGKSTPSYPATQSGTYTLTATTGPACRHVEAIELEFTSRPEVELGPDTTVCAVRQLEITPYNDAPKPVFRWSTGTDSERLTVTTTGTYALTVTDEDSGCQGQDRINVYIGAPPLISLAEDTTFCPGQPLELAAQSYSGGNVTFEWQDGSPGDTYRVDSIGTYRLRAFNGLCDTVATVRVRAGDCTASLYLPNAFSPNGDGRNDRFRPFGPYIELVKLQAFNRWGVLVYDGRGADAAWNGKALSEDAPAGIYIFKLEYTNLLNGERAMASGEVVLLR